MPKTASSSHAVVHVQITEIHELRLSVIQDDDGNITAELCTPSGILLGKTPCLSVAKES